LHPSQSQLASQEHTSPQAQTSAQSQLELLELHPIKNAVVNIKKTDSIKEIVFIVLPFFSVYKIDLVPTSKKYLGRPFMSTFWVCWSIPKCLNSVAVTFCGVIGSVFGSSALDVD